MKINHLLEIGTHPLPQEIVTILAQGENCRIEKIVSPLHLISPWYDQEEFEFVTLLQGNASLEWADGSITPLTIGEGLTIPPHEAHRVVDTSQNPLCIWLCIFWKN